MDQLLDAAIVEDSLEPRRELLKKAQIQLARDLPYFPLWSWENVLISRKGLRGVTPEALSLSGDYEPLTWLR
jgi:ABC-type transport system substrate-binding protein